MVASCRQCSIVRRVFAVGLVGLLSYGAGVGTAREAFAADGFPPVEGATPVVYKRHGDTELKLHVFRPQGEAAAPRPAIVFFFGGGWRTGTPRHFASQAQHLAERGMVACCAEYRIFDQHRSTLADAVADAKSAMRYVREHANELQIDPERIAAAGGSAGGHLAASVATLEGLDDPQDHSSISCRPGALLLFNPALDLVEIAERLGGTGRDDDLQRRLGADAVAVSPAAHVVEGLPPTIIFHGTSDATVPFQQAVVFQERMQAAGNRCEVVSYEGRTHGFFNDNRDGRRDYDDTLRRGDEFLVSLGWLEASPPGESPDPCRCR